MQQARASLLRCRLVTCSISSSNRPCSARQEGVEGLDSGVIWWIVTEESVIRRGGPSLSVHYAHPTGRVPPILPVNQVLSFSIREKLPQTWGRNERNKGADHQENQGNTAYGTLRFTPMPNDQPRSTPKAPTARHSRRLTEIPGARRGRSRRRA